jgi:hypothetical protein
MEKLTAEQQANIKRMSDVRLTSKLTQAGVSVDKLESMDRTAMMNAWAELIVVGKDKPVKGADVVPAAGGDADIEKRKLEFEMWKYEEEKKRMAAEEQARRDFELWKLEEKRKRQEAEMTLRQQELELRRMEAEDRKKEAERRESERKLLEAREEREKERNDAVVTKVKLFGDAVRSAAFKMSNDPIELIPFFENVERLYADLDVPDELHVQLLRPYLSDRAKTLLTRLDPDRAKDYSAVKEYLLHQFELSPRVFLSKFNNITRQSDETMILFSSRLKALLKYYLDSRKVDSLEQFVSLVIADRIKGTLSEECLRHVLSIEASAEKGWLDYDDLAVAIDIYLSNHVRDKPVVHGSVNRDVALTRRPEKPATAAGSPQPSVGLGPAVRLAGNSVSDVVVLITWFHSVR